MRPSIILKRKEIKGVSSTGMLYRVATVFEEKIQRLFKHFKLTFQTYSGDDLPSYFNGGDFRERFFHFFTGN